MSSGESILQEQTTRLIPEDSPAYKQIESVIDMETIRKIAYEELKNVGGDDAYKKIRTELQKTVGDKGLFKDVPLCEFKEILSNICTRYIDKVHVTSALPKGCITKHVRKSITALSSNRYAVGYLLSNYEFIKANSFKWSMVEERLSKSFEVKDTNTGEVCSKFKIDASDPENFKLIIEK